MSKQLRTALLALPLCLAACSEDAPASKSATAAAHEGVDKPRAVSSENASDPLVLPPSWMPADWDRNVYPGSGDPMSRETEIKLRQSMLATTPFTLWAVAHDTRVTEAFQPVWVWSTAIRSCEKAIQLSEDLAGEFGDRARGQAALSQARNELKAWAATQPAELTLFFTAHLGQWNASSQTFPLQQASRATTLRTKDMERFDPFFDGANVEFWTDGTGQAINHFQASLTAPQCRSQDGTKIYKFPRMSQWWVVFGEADRGMGGLTDYKSREMLPQIGMSREAAAALAARNPDRKVEVAVTFAPLGSTFVKGTDQSVIRAKFRKVTVTDIADGSMLASRDY